MKSNRRSFIAMAGLSALGAAGLRSASAQVTSPFALSNGTTVTWSDPWGVNWHGADGLFADSVTLTSTNGQGVLQIGYFSTPMTIDEMVAAGASANEPTGTVVLGGSDEHVDANGVKVADVEYQVRHFIQEDGSPWGIYMEFTNGTNFTGLLAPVAEFAATVASAQEKVTVDGVPLLQDMDGAELQTALEEGPIGGEYTDATGNLHVTWLEGWTIVSQNEVGVEIANQEQSVVLNTTVYELEGGTWEEQAQIDSDWLVGDQGVNATIMLPVVTETGFSFSTNGDYGLRLVQGTAIENDPEHYILSFAANVTVNGAEALALLQQIQAEVTINGQPPLQGLDAFIDMSTS